MEPLVDRYLAQAGRFKVRRLIGLIVLCALLFGVLLLIYAKGWYDLAGGKSGGSGWVIVGLVVAVAAIAGVVVDMVYRREL